LKLDRKELEAHDKLCNCINNEFEKQNVIMNKMTKEDLDKNKKEFLSFMNGIENINFFINENNEKNKENDEKKSEIYFNNNDMNILVKSLIFIFSRKMSFIEDKINKINKTMQQFSENNLIFYQSINEELENINEKISNLNNNENTSNKNSISKNSINNNNNTFSPDNLNFGFNSPTIRNTKKNYNKTIFPKNNKEEKLLLSNVILTERQNSVKTLEKFKTSYPKEFLNSSRNKNKKKNLEIKEKISHNIGDKNKINVLKKGTTINNLLNKEKFIKEMKSTTYMEKLKGIQTKKQNLIINTGNPDEKLKNEYINTKIINGQRNNYIISNNFNTINSFHDKTYSEKSSSKGIEQSISGGNHQELIINNSIK
jgi:hypothetical protein